jgi:hypothetical protein
MSRHHSAEQNHNIKESNKSFGNLKNFKQAYFGNTLKNQTNHDKVKSVFKVIQFRMFNPIALFPKPRV